MTAGHDELRRLLGGYLLGGLDDADTERLDNHLLTCDECRAELDQLAPVPELLRTLPQPNLAVPPGTRPTPDRIEALLGRMRGEQARERRRSAARRLAIAAAVLLIAAVSGVLVLNHDNGTVPPPPVAQSSPAQPRLVAAFHPAGGSGLTGEAVLTGKTWGVSVDLAVQQLAGSGPFVCHVRNRGGKVEQAAIWGPTPSGNAKVTGASSIQLTSVAEVEVADAAGHVLGTAYIY